MFKFDVNPSKKLIQVTVEGIFDEEEAGRYVATYQQTVKQVKPEQYALYIDARLQKVVSGTLFEDLQGAVDLYLSSGFKKVMVTFPISAVATLQIKRIKGYEKLTLVNSPEEAYALV